MLMHQNIISKVYNMIRFSSISLSRNYLAYHLRQHRKQYRLLGGISQRQLAVIAKVSRSYIEDAETATTLQKSVEALLRVSIALETPMEDLFAPSLRSVLREEIVQRRYALSGSIPREDSQIRPAPILRLGITYRAPHLVMAVAGEGQIIDVRRHRVDRKKPSYIQGLILREARAYAVRELIVEDKSKILSQTHSIELPYQVLTFRKAKQSLMPNGNTDQLLNKHFFRSLIAQYPELQRYVKVIPSTGNVALTERWRVATLTAVTLALVPHANLIASDVSSSKVLDPVIVRTEANRREWL